MNLIVVVSGRDSILFKPWLGHIYAEDQINFAWYEVMVGRLQANGGGATDQFFGWKKKADDAWTARSNQTRKHSIRIRLVLFYGANHKVLSKQCATGVKSQIREDLRQVSHLPPLLNKLSNIRYCLSLILRVIASVVRAIP